MRSFSLALLITLTFVDRSQRPCYFLSSYTYLLMLGSTTPYRGTQVVTLVMPLRYPQPILFLDIRLDNSRYFSNTSRSHTSSTSSFCDNFAMDWASIGQGFAKEEASRHSPSTSSNLTPLLSTSAKTQSEMGTLAVFGPEMSAPRHIITSTRATYQHRSAILHLFCRNYDFQNNKTTQKTKKKLKK